MNVELSLFCLFLRDENLGIGERQTRIYFQTNVLVWKLSIKFHSLLEIEVSVQYPQSESIIWYDQTNTKQKLLMGFLTRETKQKITDKFYEQYTRLENICKSDF